jgi:hypothetical protein
MRLLQQEPEPVVIWNQRLRAELRAKFRAKKPGSWNAVYRVRRCVAQYSPHYSVNYLVVAAACLLLLTVAAPLHGRVKKDAIHYGEGLIVNIPLPEYEVEQVVDEVAQNTIIRGTKEYNKDEYVSGAAAVRSTPVFPPWKEGGKVFYKVRQQALDPRNFKDGGDVGTLAVRYVLQPQGDQNTVLRIDALFVEDFRRTVHASNGSVESSEYKDIQDHLASVELMKKETADALEAKQEHLAKEKSGAANDTIGTGTPPPAANPGESTNGETKTAAAQGSAIQGSAVQGSTSEVTFSQPSPAGRTRASVAPPPSSIPPSSEYRQPSESLEQHVAELRQQVERLVKKPGAPLQSAPFHTATTLKSLEPGAEVLILISTPYWYGVETHDGQHGWIRRDQLEQVP